MRRSNERRTQLADKRERERLEREARREAKKAEQEPVSKRTKPTRSIWNFDGLDEVCECFGIADLNRTILDRNNPGAFPVLQQLVCPLPRSAHQFAKGTL